jgi:hypothetical protein
MFPALDAKAAGFKVYAVIDASGDPSEMVSRTTVARFIQAGIVPISTNAVVCELLRTWNRPEAAQFAELLVMTSPNYRAVMESYQKAQEAVTAKTKGNKRERKPHVTATSSRHRSPITDKIQLPKVSLEETRAQGRVGYDRCRTSGTTRINHVVPDPFGIVK